MHLACHCPYFKKGGRKMLTDKEKLILHYVAFCSSRNIEDHHIRKMVLDVIHSRCRSIAPEDAHDIILEIDEELLAGKIMFEEMLGDLMWSMTGERPNRNNWNDMR
jgi:hypothetical protein|tara:strand:+ start:289 stop:606 length:318 start_codon:yes stop_codon:yes gene_type:complete